MRGGIWQRHEIVIKGYFEGVCPELLLFTCFRIGGLLDEGRVPRGVSPGAYRGAQGRSLKNPLKMFVFNCMIHFVTCTRNYLPKHGVIGVSVASFIDAERRPKSGT